MQLFKLLSGVAIVAALSVSCKKIKEEVKDTTPAELKSFAILAADNSEYISEDIKIEPATASMVVRIKGGGKDKNLVASVSAGENDVISVGDNTITDGKIKFNATYPLDIVVTNSKSKLSSRYEVKVGKILGLSAVQKAVYKENGAFMGKDFCTAINKADKMPYVAYLRSSKEKAKAQISVVKFNGTSFDAVGPLALTDTTADAADNPVIAFGPKNNVPHLLYYGADKKSLFSMRKFEGGEWVLVGKDGFSHKPNLSYGNPPVYFATGTNNPEFFYTSDEGASRRSAEQAVFDGTKWDILFNPLPKCPAYDKSSKAMFYLTALTQTENAVYLVTSINRKGHNVYKNDGKGWTLLVENFIPEGEEFGIPTNLSVKNDGKGGIYVLASLSQNAKIQIYKLDETKAKLVPAGNAVAATKGKSGSVEEVMDFGINPKTGDIVAVFADKDKTAFFMVLEKDRWSEPVALSGKKLRQARSARAFIDFAEDGSGYITYLNEENSLELYSIEMEKDILPE